MEKRKRQATKNERHQRALDIARGISVDPFLLSYAVEAVEVLIDLGGYVTDTKSEFACRLGWYTEDDKPDTEKVQKVCTLTREQSLYPLAEATLGGMVVGYAGNTGGLTLIDPTGSTSPKQLIHVLRGDIETGQKIKTILRRRVPMWRAVSESFAGSGDTELARLFAQGENEIAMSGVLSDSLQGKLFATLRSRGLVV